MKEFYVYRHIRKDRQTPFYVGKGLVRRKRASDKGNRNKYWHNIVEKAGYIIEIVSFFESEEDALNFEICLIKLYKKFGYCEANLTLGGEGCVGMVHSAKTRKLIGIRGKGRRHRQETKILISNHSFWKGKRLSPEEIRNRVEKRDYSKVCFSGSRNSNFKGFWVTPIGKFDSLFKAAEITGIPKTSLSRFCKTGKPGFAYEKIKSKLVI